MKQRFAANGPQGRPEETPGRITAESNRNRMEDRTAPNQLATAAAHRPTSWQLAVACGAAAAAVAFRHLYHILSAPSSASPLEGAEAFLFEPSGASPVAILAGTAWLLAGRWHRFRAALGSSRQRVMAVGLFLPAALLCGWSYYTREVFLLIPSLSLTVLAVALWLGGFPALRAVALPASFLLLALPVPTPVLNQIMYPLQLATARAAAAVLAAVGMPVTSQADRILSGNAVFQVIESCAGLRTVETIFMASFLYQDLFFRSRLQSVLLVAASPLIGLLANLIRVLTIVLNPYSRLAAVHTAQGLVMIVVAVLMLAVFDWLLTLVLPRPARARRRVRAVALPSTGDLVVPVAALTVLAAVTASVRPWAAPHTPRTSLSSLPVALEGWQASSLAIDREFLGSISFSEWVHRRYDRSGEEVDILLGSDDRLTSWVDFQSLKTAVPGSGWQIEREGSVELPALGRTAERYVASSLDERRLVYLWYVDTAPPSVETLRSTLALDRGPFRRPGRALVVRLTTPIDALGRPAAEERLQQFAGLLPGPLGVIANGAGS